MAIQLKTKDQIERMRRAGRVVYKVLQHCRDICKPGITTREIDEQAYEVFTAEGAKGLFKNYPTYKSGEGFPSNLCISVNEVVVHGIADDRVIKDGDIVGCDCGVKLDGWCGDSATTALVGNVKPKVRELCEVTSHVLEIAIGNIRPGKRWSKIAKLMQRYAESAGFSVVRNFVGHGIGQTMHQEPQVPNYADRQTLQKDFVLIEGMVLAIEPMCNMGSAQTEIDTQDGGTVCTADRQPSAHYEHTIAVTAKGADVLTDGR